MLIQEARWFARMTAEMSDSSIFPMLNIGSHTEEFRKKDQPWIDEYIFGPARERKQVVKHLDIRAAPGVDIVGNLADYFFLKDLSKMEFKSLLCSNLLEHVPNRIEIARLMTSIVPIGGYLFVSCPFKFPYHPDPIDTMFRPGILELASMFPGTSVYQQAIVNCGTLLSYITARIWGNPLAFCRTLFRRSVHFHNLDSIASLTGLIPWTSRRFQETCLVLRKESEVVV